ncbi:MAG TPA: DUF1707 domain-containing protein [Streptosporangiaceae bacterium]|nr:DUF1707 domain-containing protein [Streptosporangiaceae bacterium]
MQDDPTQGDPAEQDGPRLAESELRVSDAERDHVADFLSGHAAAGRLTTTELEQRLDRAYAARTSGELAEIVRDLPGLAPAAKQARPRRWFVSIMGSSRRRITHRIRRVVSIAVFASPDLDLCHAQLEGDEIAVKGFVFWGWPDIYVPDSLGLELSGFTLMGGDAERGSSRVAAPGAAVVKVRTYGLIGGYTVWRLPPELQGLPYAKARKAAKELPR